MDAYMPIEVVYLIYFLACTLAGMWLEIKIGRLRKLKQEAGNRDSEHQNPSPFPSEKSHKPMS